VTGTTKNPLRASKTKIVATVGPACQTQEQLTALIQAGVDVFRLNMAHGKQNDHGAVIQRIRAVSEQLEQPIGILVDLGGPKIRLGELPGEALECHDGAEFRFIRGTHSSTPSDLITTYEPLVDELEVGDDVLLADGTVHLKVTKKTADAAEVRVVQPGLIRSRQGVNLPGVKLSVKAITDIDRDNAIWAAKSEVDFLGMSFVRTGGEVRELRTLLEDLKLPHRRPSVVAKIEKPAAIENLEEIVREADAVMVARGDLGVEIDVARLAVEQKRIIATCNRYLKPVITATQMLDSMQHSKTPTRAEATDVANALLDGTDACMLSAETAVGLYPPLAVKMMNRISLATEPLMQGQPPRQMPSVRPAGLHEITEAVANYAGRIAEQLKAKLVVASTHSGLSALSLSGQRRSVPVIGISDSPASLRQMCLYWGVTPLAGIPTDKGTDVLLYAIEEWGRRQNMFVRGDRIVLIASSAMASSGHNVVLVHEVRK